MMKSAVSVCLVCIFLSTTAFGVEIKPANISIPSSAGGTFSFDFVINNQPVSGAPGLQVTIGSITGATGLTFNASASTAVKTDSVYWLYGNQPDPFANASGGSYSFSDGASDPTTAPLDIGDKIARFAFTWNGNPGDFIFSLNLNPSSSYVDLPDFSGRLPFTLPTGTWYSGPITNATASSFTVHIPEPVSMSLLGLGGLILFRKHRR
jgi:hypothetical protein